MAEQELDLRNVVDPGQYLHAIGDFVTYVRDREEQMNQPITVVHSRHEPALATGLSILEQFSYASSEEDENVALPVVIPGRDIIAVVSRSGLESTGETYWLIAKYHPNSINLVILIDEPGSVTEAAASHGIPSENITLLTATSHTPTFYWER